MDRCYDGSAGFVVLLWGMASFVGIIPTLALIAGVFAATYATRDVQKPGLMDQMIFSRAGQRT